MRIHLSIKYPWLSLLTKGDKILIVIVLLLSLVSFYLVYKLKAEGEYVVIEVAGQEKYRFPLQSKQRVIVNGPVGETSIEIHHGTARITKSACPNKVCIKTGTVHRAGEIIVCAPNQVVVRILGDHKNYFNEVTE